MSVELIVLFLVTNVIMNDLNAVLLNTTHDHTGHHTGPHRTPQDLVRLLNSLLGVK